VVGVSMKGGVDVGIQRLAIRRSPGKQTTRNIHVEPNGTPGPAACRFLAYRFRFQERNHPASRTVSCCIDASRAERRLVRLK